jgi:mono/diheme cytochrome c family protein
LANVVTGVAATGRPIFGTVTLKDSSSPAVELTTSTASDGTFAFNTTNLTAPFILKTSSGGKNYYSIATSGSGIDNINPLTTIVVIAAAGGADLDAIYTAGSASTLKALVSNLPAAEVLVQTALAPIFSQFGVGGSIINSTYAADHTGIDAILDVIDVTNSAGTITLTNRSDLTVIYAAPASNFSAGTIVTANIPAVPVQSLGANLYRANCAKCHGDIMNSSIIGRSSVVKIMGAIASDFGGMSVLGALTADDIQAISDAIPAQATPPAPGTLSGSALYAINCAACHGPLATSAKLGVTIVRLQNAISTNAGSNVGSGMGRLSTLSAIDLNAIVVALNPTNTTPPPTTLDGATLYTTYCSGCHGSLANSTKKGLTLARFSAAIANPATGMAYLSSTLSAAQVNAIISVMPPLPADGPGLYATNCETCHGPLASSYKGGATVTRINAGIAANPAQMGGLATSLSAQQITLIANTLAGVTPPAVPVDGPGLYAANCASCHGALASSLKGGATVARINAGIAANPAQMGGFASSLNAQQITLIANALAGVTPPIPVDGPGLYGVFCSACHNPLATSTKGGATAAKIQQEITNNRNGVMGAANLAALTPTQIGLIATALAPIAPPACGTCHAVALASLTSGQHVFHGTSSKITGAIKTAFAATTSCAICHGTGYATNTNGNLLTHNNGSKTIALNAAANSTSVFGIKAWTPPVLSGTGTVTKKGSCTPGCHGAKSW